MLSGHGGNIREVSKARGIPEVKLIDFSSNVNPLGFSPKIRHLGAEFAGIIRRYPDPECVALRSGLSGYLGVSTDNILAGNGSNELIHLVPRALNCSSALIYKPAFCEYELSVKIAKGKPYFLFAREENGFTFDIEEAFTYVKKVEMIILCNPNNPTGNLLKKDALLELAAYCAKNKTYLFIDEVFMEFTDDENSYSLKNMVTKNKYLLILRSLTKFFSLAGLRIGYLLADKNLIKKISLLQPTWSINGLAQEIALRSLSDAKFIKKSKEYIIRERDFLFSRLKRIRGIYPYYPNANFIFCKILDKRLNSGLLYLRLLRSGILIRDCSNFDGLDNRFFRIAVRKHQDNLHLLNKLQNII